MQTARRDFLKFPLAAGAAAAVPGAAPAAAPKIDEYDPSNTKIATVVSPNANDDQFLFLQQIGLRWVQVAFGPNASYDFIKTTQDRLARFGLRIHCAYQEGGYRTQKR